MRNRHASRWVRIAVLLICGGVWSPHAEATNVCGSITTNTTWTKAGSPYILTCAVTVFNNATLTIEPDVQVLFNTGTWLAIGQGASNSAALIAQGTVSQPITFTANSATPTPGFWGGLMLNGATASTIIDHCLLEYGGGPALAGSLYLIATPQIIQNTTIRYSSKAGVDVNGTAVTLTNVTITGGLSEGVFVPSNATAAIEHSTISANNKGIVLSRPVGTERIRHNNINGNVAGGLINQGSAPVDARLNWWGHPSGPSGNGQGTGDAVTGNVLFEPWLGSSFTTPFEWTDALNSPDPFTQAGGWTTFFGMLPESGTWNVTVTNSAGALVKTFSGGPGTALSQDWIGDDQGGAGLPDGTYTYRLEATSTVTAQAAATAVGTVTLKATLPIANITAPTPNGVVTGPVSILGTAAGANFQSYKIEYGVGIAPTSWIVIGSGSTPVVNGLLALWDTTGFGNPLYTLRLTVTPTSGQSASESVTVQLLQFFNLSDIPDPFSPNGDGVDDTTTISASLTLPLNWTLTLTDSTGTMVRTFTGSGQTIAQIWDGTNTAGALAPDSLYTYQFQATEPSSGVTTTATGQVQLRYISITTVSVSPTALDPYNAEQAGISYTLVHALGLPMDVTVNLYNEPSKQLVRTLTFTAQPSGSHTVFWDGRTAGGSVAALGAPLCG